MVYSTMKKSAFILALLALSGEAAAQWQVPNHSVPLGRGSGTGFSFAAPGTSGYPLLSTGAGSAPAFGLLPVAAIAQIATSTVIGNMSGSTGAPSAVALSNTTLRAGVNYWALSGSNISYNAGNVGLNVPGAPAARLTVTGPMQGSCRLVERMPAMLRRTLSSVATTGNSMSED